MKKANKRVQAIPKNTQAVMTTYNGIKKQHKSLAAVTAWLKKQTGTSVSRATLTNTYLDINKEYLGYKLERLHLDHPGYIVSVSEEEI